MRPKAKKSARIMHAVHVMDIVARPWSIAGLGVRATVIAKRLSQNCNCANYA